MPLTKPVKRTIDLTIPAILAAIVIYFLYTRKSSWQVLLIGGGVSFLLGYLVISQVTKAVRSGGPAPVPTGGGCDSYDPKPLVDAIFKDCTASWYTERDRNLYTRLLGLSDCQLISCYNYWNTAYYSQADNLSLPVTISEQSNWADYLFEQQQKDLAAKFATLNLQ